MGAGYTKILTYLDIGPEAKEDKLKNKYLKILTSGIIPKNPGLTWKSLSLDVKNTDKTANNLKEGAQFIHSSRARKEQVLVCISPTDPDSIIFATAYIMILSGLSPEQSELAIANAIKESELKLEGKYKKALEMLYKQDLPRILREQLFKPSGEYPIGLLTEDVNRIYELAGLPKPSLGQVRLETDNHAVPYTTTINTSPSDGANRSGQTREHTPMTLEERENHIPAGPAIRSGNLARRDYMNLAVEQSAYIDASLLKQGPPKTLNTHDYASTLMYAEHAVDNHDGYVPTMTEWNSVRSGESQLLQPTLVSGARAEKSDVINKPEEVRPAMTRLVANVKPSASPESTKPPVSEATVDILTELKDTTSNLRSQETRNTEISINGTKNVDSREPRIVKTNVKIVRRTPANIEQNIKIVNESLSKNDANDQTKRKSIQIIRHPHKVNAK